MSQTSTSHIAVIEDDFDQRNDLVEYLQWQGFAARGFDCAEALYKAWPESHFELAIIDIGLPGENGLQLTEWLRNQSQTIGIVMLTAMGETSDQVTGLTCGADAYLVKSASLELIEATCRSVLRRLSTNTLPSHQVAEQQAWRLAVRSWQLISPDGAAIKVTHTESVFLRCLMRETGNPVSRTVILEALDKPDTLSNQRNLDSCVNRLRRKVFKKSGIEAPIHPCYGTGYTFIDMGLVEE